MSDIEEQVEVRKTRSGRAVKTPVKQKAPSKAVGRKTRKRTVVMEVEVTDDEESEQVEQPEEMEPSIKKSKMSDITEETSETLENIIDTMNILPDDLIPKSEDKKPEDDEAEALKEESESLETAELVMNDVNMLGDISIDLNMDDIQEKETNGDTDDISENVIEKEDLDSIMVTQENGLEIENETETAVEDSLPVVTPEEDPLPVNPSPKEEPLPVNLSPKEEPLPVNPPLKEEPLPVNPPPKEEPLPVNPPPKEESLPVNPPKEESLPVNPPPKEESLPINPPKEESLPVNLPPKEEALPVSPSPKEEALPVSPPQKEEPLPVSPPPKEEPLPVSPSAKEEALPVSPPPKEEPLPVSPSPKEEPLPVNPPKEQPAGDPEAENISDEELPGVPVVKVPETEEVSDEELPGPKRAELPADTEVVSEDELPTSKKETEAEESTPPKDTNKRKEPEGDYDPTSPTSENESTPKKMKEDKEEKEKEGEHTKPSKPKKLPELDKYWKAVNDDPTDFTGWTFLLQYVDQENDMEAAREAYDAFLSHYPYCYGYWRKYADYEKRKGNRKKCEEVFERGLKAIPLSVDLWIHYLTYVKATRGDDEDYVRSQFERAVAACGLEFRSDRLWDSYIKWETEGKRLNRVTGIYDRLLATPTQGYPTHFDNFQEHVASNPPNKVLDVDEFMALRKEVRSSLKHDKVENVAENADVPPGDEDSKLSEEETKGIRERIVSIRRKIHKNSVAAVTARWNFEEGIKRPYFHVKPLERCHLKNWQDYLDFEIKHGDKVRIIVLFERCLIACALYEEYWLKYVHYLKTLKDPEVLSKIRDVYERACTIHHLKKPNLHMQWAIFEEANGNASRAVEILINLEKQVPSVLLQVAYRRINLERRRSDFEKCSQLYEHYISVSKNKAISSNITIKYARFSLKILKDFNKAHEILKTAITKDPTNSRLYLQLIDLTLQKDDVKEDEICAIIDEFLEKEGADNDQKVLFAQRKLEYLEDFGSSVQQVQAAYDQYQKYLKHNKENPKKKESKSSETTSSGKKEKTTSSSSSSQPNSYGYSYGSSSGQTSYPYSGTQQGQYNYAQYGQGSDQYQYQNWQYPQGSYGSYNQWSGYGGNYSY